MKWYEALLVVVSVAAALVQVFVAVRFESDWVTMRREAAERGVLERRAAGYKVNLYVFSQWTLSTRMRAVIVAAVYGMLTAALAVFLASG